MINRLQRTLGLLAMTSAVLGLVGCGDGPTCPSEIVVVIQSPDEGVSLSLSDDLDTSKAGIQRDVHVRSNLKRGDSLTLTIKDERTGSVSQQTAISDEAGSATFSGVTLPAGKVKLSVKGVSDCGSSFDEITVEVVTDSLCDLNMDDGPIENDFYKPLPVLNDSIDNDTDKAGFQAEVSVASVMGAEVELFALDVASNNEVSVAKLTADSTGIVRYTPTLAQGAQVLRAVCKSGSTSAASATNTVYVDTVIPVCTLTNPVDGVTVTPDSDTDTDTTGIQMTWTGSVEDAGEKDVENEDSRFFLDSVESAGTAINANGEASSVSVVSFNSPGIFPLRFETQDHAGNACIGSFDAKIIMDGCSIEITAPNSVSVVAGDSDSDGSNGLHSDFTIGVDSECAGETISIDCGLGAIANVVPPGSGTIDTVLQNVKISNAAISEGDVVCKASVTNTDNYTTSHEQTVAFDTQAPAGTLNFTNPNDLACGDSLSLTTGSDSNNDLSDGFQIEVRVVTASATERFITVENSTCVSPCFTVAPPAGASVEISLEPGINDIRGIFRDDLGNEYDSGECIITLTDITVAITEPVASGALGVASPGLTVNVDGDAEITICATSTEIVDSTGVLNVDGAGDFPMSITGGQFCTDAPVVLSEGSHEIRVDVNANVGSRMGTDLVSVSVDLVAPDAPTNFVASSPNRQQIDVSWTGVAGADSYVLKYSSSAFTDFENQGTVVEGVGAANSFSIEMLNAGTNYYLAVAAVDAVGNVSSELIYVNPDLTGDDFMQLALDSTGAIEPFELDDADPSMLDANSGFPRQYGQTTVYGNFNNDAYGDVAVTSPQRAANVALSAGEVYVYFGSVTGISSTPDVTITDDAVFQLGYSMARLNWSDGDTDGLAISTRNSNEIFIFHGTTISTAAAGSNRLTQSNADIRINVAGEANWFTGGFIGTSLSAGQIDSAGTKEDLILGASQANGGSGGVAILYGGDLTSGTITLSEDATSGMMGGLVGHIFSNPVIATNPSDFGSRVAYLGDTRTGDGVGDIAVAYAADNQDAEIIEDNSFYVLRGRTPGTTSGMSFITFNAASDLKVINPIANNITNGFGGNLGSIDDQDGDGFRDIVVTGHFEGTGRAWIVSGSRTGNLTLNGPADYITRVSGAVGTGNFGSGMANNVLVENPDINNDGREDLLIAGGKDGISPAPTLFVWYGGSIPTGNTTSNSSNYSIEATSEFANLTVVNAPTAVQVIWAGDVNGDGLSDICLTDWKAESEGLMEILWDE